MKRLIIVILALSALLVGFSAPVMADPVNLFLDTAPNAPSSPLWPAFRDATYASIYDGTFVNQAHSTNPVNVGTINYDVTDYMVYSFGDLGKRLHTFYWIPDTTIANLTGHFQVSIEYNYAGTWYNPYEEYGWGEWVTPGSWINYNGGVIGSMGNALWGAYGYTTDTPAARAALALDLIDAENYLGDTRFLARLDGTVYELRAHHDAAVPLPGTVLLLGSGLAVLAFYRRSRQAAKKS